MEIKEVIRKRNKKGYFFKYYVLICDCGREFERQYSYVNNNLHRKISCGCSHPNKNMESNQHPSWKGVGDLSSLYCKRLEISAKNRNIIFKISKEYLWELFLEQNNRCKLSNLEISVKRTKNNNLVQTASVDRIDNTQGYIEGNVQWVHKTVNNMKYKFEESYFKNLVKLILTPHVHQPKILIDDVPNYYISDIKSKAKKKNINFDITKQDLLDKINEQNGRCYYSNVKLKFSDVKNKRINQNASLDRIDSNLGYTKDNLQWIQKDINYMKNNLPESEFFYFCNKIAEHSL